MNSLDLFLAFGLPALFITLGLVFGSWNHRRHLHDLEEREARLAHFTLSQIKSFPGGIASESTPQMVVAEAVISSDYVKSFLGQIRNFFGGEVKSFSGLADRARREATLRMMEEAESLGYNALCNVRLETADVGGRGNRRKNKVIMATILAYATAYRVAEPSTPLSP